MDLGTGMLYSVVNTKLPEKMLYGWLENKYQSATLKSLCEWASQKSRHATAADEDIRESTSCNKGRMEILIE